MNALTEIASLLRKPEQLNCKYWCAYANDISDKNRLFDNYNDSDSSIESATNKLNDFIQDLTASGCNLEIWFSESPRPSKGGFRVKFFLHPNSSTPSNINASIGAVSNSVSKEEAERIAEEKFKAFMLNWEKEKSIEDLRRQNLELQKRVRELAPTGLDRIAERIIPFIPTIMDSLKIKKVVENSNIHHSNGSQDSTNDEANQKRAEEALKNLADGDEDFVLTLEKLVKLKNENPQLYNMAKSNL